MPDRPLPGACRQHLERMTGPFGIWRHARATEPDLEFGSCTDDVARALTVDMLQRRTLGWEAVATTAHRSLAFLQAAFDPMLSTFHDFRDAEGRWLDVAGSQDCQGRALLSLGIAARDAPEVALRRDARALFQAASPAARALTSPRAVASAILGCDAALEAHPDPATQDILVQLVRRLQGAFLGIDPDSEWPWPETELTYENALLPHALIVAGRRLAHPGLRRVGLDVLDWLMGIQTTRLGMFTPVGNDGWWPRGGVRSQYAQQPIEATALILAAEAAYDVTGDVAYRRAAESAYAWFLGDNEGGTVVADPVTGGCRDGLEAAGVNENQGAESTLMWLTAVETIRAMRSRAGSARARSMDPVVQLVKVR